MSNSSHQHPPARRRSSVAYDPARDTFTEIPDTIPENAMEDNTSNHEASESAVHSSPSQGLGSINRTEKRRRSESIEARPRKGGHDDSTASKKARVSPQPQAARQNGSASRSPRPAPRTVADLPRVPRRPREDGEVSTSRPAPSAYSRRPDNDRPRSSGYGRPRSRSPTRRSPPSAYRRRSPQQRRERPRSPSPIRRSPPREPIVRPGGVRGRGRNVLAEQQRLAAERERQQSTVVTNTNRGVQDVSNQFYNARPEWVRQYGRDWRKTESQIKGLRVFNNWIKSCVIQKFSPEEEAEPEELGWGEEAKQPEQRKPLIVLDIGCGKGGDLNKWQLAPQHIGLYVGLDPADTSVKQAQDRYSQMRRGRKPIFDGRFHTKDCFGEWIGDVPIVREVGIDPNVGNGTISRFGGGGFDIVTMMFSMHYAFESEEKVKMMLRNVAGSLKKGGRFIGVVPNSDMLADRIREWFEKKISTNGEQNGSDATDERPQETQADTGTKPNGGDDAPNWGNSIYTVRFPPNSSVPDRQLTAEGTFRPPFAWKYTYWMAEAVDVPEFVVPWEAFRAMAEGFNLEQRYRKPFLEIWESEKKDRELSALAGRMGVLKNPGGANASAAGGGDGEDGELNMTEEEKEAVAFYHAFCFVKV